jgi:hypothetical protein
MTRSKAAARAAFAFAGASIMLAACASDRTPTVTATAMAPAATPLPVGEAMAGRWQLAAIGSSACAMTFSGAPGAAEGTIAPEGGCPGNFFTSRKWTFEQGSLVIRDHNGAPLGQLAAAGPGRFDGKATNGIMVTLTR